MKRRGFISGCAACAALSACKGARDLLTPTRRGGPPPRIVEAGKTRIGLIFSHPPRDASGWPHRGFDYEARKRELVSRLQRRCPDVAFQVATVHRGEQAAALIAKTRDSVDAYVLYLIGLFTNVGMIVAGSGVPTLLVDDLFGGSGEFLGAYSAARKKGWRAAGVASSRFEDVVDGIRALEGMHKLRRSVIVDVTEGELDADAAAIETLFGTKVVKVAPRALNDEMARVPRDAVARTAERWIAEADELVEPTYEEVVRAAAMYLAIKSQMKRHRAQGATVTCLPLFHARKLPAYPCLAFFQLNNEGYVGACEGDLKSAITMLVMRYLTGRPGYISDPVVDTAKRQIIYAHCVANTRVYGPDGPSSPYRIRSHAEDRRGASVQARMPVGELTTTMKFAPRGRRIIYHQAKTVGNLDHESGCRTKLVAAVDDPFKLLDHWSSWGWHRVTFYGDLRPQLRHVAALYGLELVKEG